MNWSQKENFIILLNSTLIILLPIVLISGPFLPDLFLLIINLSFIYLIFINKNLKYLKNYIFYIFIIFCLLISTVSIFTLNVTSIQSSIFYFRFGLLIFSVSFFLKKNENIFIYLFYILICIYSFLIVDSLYQYNFGKNLLGFEYINEENFRITSFFGDDEIMGSYSVRLLPLLLFLILYKFTYIKTKYLINICILITLILVILSGERTSIALFFLLVTFVYFSSKNLRRNLNYSIIFGFIIISSILYSSKVIKERVIDTTINQLGLNSDSERIVLFSKIYEGHYKIAKNMFFEKPIFGHGVKMFRFYCSEEKNYVAEHACTTHPHNFYAQMFAETGILGSIFLWSLYFIVIYFFLKNLYFQIYHKKQFISDHGICLLSSLFINLFPILPSGNFFNNWLSIVMYLPLGFLIYLMKEKKFYV